jgi:hypothetical protein
VSLVPAAREQGRRCGRGHRGRSPVVVVGRVSRVGGFTQSTLEDKVAKGLGVGGVGRAQLGERGNGDDDGLQTKNELSLCFKITPNLL